MTFSDFGLDKKILKAVSEQNYHTPTPIQAQSIPAVLQGRDVMAAAQTGTGKTAGFTLPILHKLLPGRPAGHNEARVLILAPTRELAAQVGESVETYGQHLPLKSQVVYGGVKINPQMMRLRKGADILIATPGRLLDLANQNAVHFRRLEMLVLDEADRMLDMGFIHDIKKILNLLPKKKQSLLFSATFSKEIRSLAKGLIINPLEISVTPPNSTANTVKQWIHPVDKKRKPQLLLDLIVDHGWEQVLVFTKTKHGANKLTRHLDGFGVKSAAIHGNKSQNTRLKTLQAFKDRELRVLVATDIAARGIDVDSLSTVINFDLPMVAEDYVHRIGRTGRAGAKGQAVSLVSADEFMQLSAIENLIKKLLHREILDGYEPDHSLPESKLGRGKPPRPAAKKQSGSGNPGGHSKNGGRSKSGGRSKRPSGDKANGAQRRGQGPGSRGQGPSRPGRARRSASARAKQPS